MLKRTPASGMQLTADHDQPHLSQGVCQNNKYPFLLRPPSPLSFFLLILLPNSVLTSPVLLTTELVACDNWSLLQALKGKDTLLS